MKIDVHQHLWTEPLVRALAARRELPFVRRENGLTVLYLAGERPYVIDLASETPARRAALVERDGLERALLCLSSPLGIEWLPREQASALIDAYHEGALSLGDPFGVWGAIALERADPDDVDRAARARLRRAVAARGRARERRCAGRAEPGARAPGVARRRRCSCTPARACRRAAPARPSPRPRSAIRCGGRR